MNDDDLINQVYRKIEREKVIINAANAMRQSSNPQVQQSLDSQVREARRGISYLEERMQELQLRRRGQNANAQSLPTSASGGAPIPPAHGSSSLHQRELQNAPIPPSKGSRAGYMADGGEYSDPGAGGYMSDLSGGQGMMPPRAPFGPPAPGSTVPKSRSNYTKLGQSVRLRASVLVTLSVVYRSYQVRYAIFRTTYSVDVVPTRIQIKR